MLKTLTFTGVDEKTDLGWAIEMTRRYPNIEFGILVGSHTGEGGRFPDIATICKWKSEGFRKLRLSLHLCGKFSRFVNKEQSSFWVSHELKWGIWQFRDLCVGFGRAQVNARAYKPETIENFADVCIQRVILQHRDWFNSAPILHDNIEYLFDVSGGRGKNSIGRWPPPDDRFKCGYSGGVGPHNIKDAVEFVNRWPDNETWIDMESEVRTDDVFDQVKVEQVCEIVFGKGLS